MSEQKSIKVEGNDNGFFIFLMTLVVSWFLFSGDPNIMGLTKEYLKTSIEINNKELINE